jgi:hypothetical protein
MDGQGAEGAIGDGGAGDWGAADLADGEGAAVNVSVKAGGVGDDVAGGRIGVGSCEAIGVVLSQGRVIDRVDVDGDGASGGAALMIGDGVGDDDLTIDVGSRIEGQGAIGGEGDATLGRIDAGVGEGEGVAVGVGVVAQHIDGDGLLFRGGGGVGVGDGAVVGAGDRDAQLCRVGAPLTVGDGVGEAVD